MTPMPEDPARGWAPEPIRDPALDIGPDEARRSEQLARRLALVHRICRAINLLGSRPWCPRLVAKGSGWLARKGAALLLPRLDEERLLVRTVYGFSLCLSRRSGWNYYLQGFYEAGTLAAMQRLLRPGDVFVDVGASVGQMTMVASRLVGDTGTVLAFEPHAGRFEELTNTVAANGASNVLCYRLGLSDESSEALLYTDRVSPSMVADGASPTGETVQVARLDDVLASLSIGPVRMVKIDVEGFELRALRGAERLLSGDDRPVLCVEYGVYDDEPFPAFIEGLGGYGLYQLALSKDFDSPLVPVADHRDLRFHDNVFCLPS